uniref:Thyroxine-binding globulin n=1 Tax=Gasterosteus aculeatus aculeatus TaxID=481459 RepID=A0AAQ4Q6P1_GASAC
MMRAAVGIWILSAVICVGGGHLPDDGDADNEDWYYEVVDDQAYQDPEPDGVGGFAYSLYRKLAAHADSKGKNILFSPSSVSVFKVKPDFLDTLMQSYYGFNVNFTQTTDSANTIKKYVEDKTNGKIDKLVEDLDPSTVMYLTSYIYYKGNWATSFDPKLTEDVPVQMFMNERVETCNDWNINTSVLHLPFKKTPLHVDEAGATAAFPAPKTFYVKINEPFVVIIIERNTKQILMMGRIINPNI